MNAVFLLTILGLALPIYSQEEQVTKKQDKRGILGLGYGGYGQSGIGLHGGVAAASGYGGYGHSGYLTAAAAPAYSLSHGVAAPVYSHASYSAPIVSHGYNAPLYSSYRLGYAGGIGHAGLGLGYANAGLGHGAALGYGAGLGHGLGAGAGAGYGGHGW